MTRAIAAVSGAGVQNEGEQPIARSVAWAASNP
jgi:hypothetical protein